MAQKFKYNGVELEESFGLNLYEMDLRQYDPAIARWTGIDPVIHHSMSTYTAFDNNPVYWSDPSGADSIYNFETGQYVINGQVVSQDEAIAYANNGGNADGRNNNTPEDPEKPKHQFYNVMISGDMMTLVSDKSMFETMSGYGFGYEDIQKAKISAYYKIFQQLHPKKRIEILKKLGLPKALWKRLVKGVGLSSIGSNFMDAHDQGLAALPSPYGDVFQPLNDQILSERNQIYNDIKWEAVLSGYSGIMSTKDLNDVLLIYSNENLFKESSINTNEGEALFSRQPTENYKYVYYGTQYGATIYLFGRHEIPE